MSKRVSITPEIEAKIRASVGDPNLDVSNFAVFEARALSTEALKRNNGLYAKARITPSTLHQMSDSINTPGKSIALQIMHENNLLPVGRVFSGTVMQMPNLSDLELRTQFYIPNDKANIIADIENSVVDEVSVGMLTNHAFCSVCEFDFLGDEADFMNVMTATCGNDHTMGVDGAHTRLVGLKDWAELSLVNRGAAKDAKILSRAKQAMSKDMAERLAASNTPLDARLLTVNTKLEASASGNNKGDLSMEKETLALLQAKAEEIATVKVELAQATKDNAGLTAKVAELTASLTAKDVELKALKEAQGTDAATLTAKVTAVETKLSAAAEKLLPHAEAALIASGVAKADLPKDVEALLSLIEEKGLKLHQIFANPARADASKSGANESDDSFRSQAFKLKN